MCISHRSAADLESGGAGLEGALGDGAGKWELAVAADPSVFVMSLLQSPTGHLTNLSTAPANVEAGAHTVPLFPSASDPLGRQGFVRVINRSDEAGDVTVHAHDDTHRVYEALTLSLDANQTRHFNSDDLELGNAAKGLTGSTGAGSGDWRLVLASDLDLEVLGYIRTTDGFLTAMHDTVSREGPRHRVAIFNPASNLGQVSRLRLMNPGDSAAEVAITGFDDTNASPGSGVTLSLAPQTARTLTAQELESGGDALEGTLGDGAGKWQLVVSSGEPIMAMSLLASPSGHLTNLSTAPAANFAPVGAAAFDDRVAGRRMVGDDPAGFLDFFAGRRFRETLGGDAYEGSYSYTFTDANRGSLVLNYDSGAVCTYELGFASRTAGGGSYTCDDGGSGEVGWRMTHIPGAEQGTDDYCRAGDLVRPGASCDLYETPFRFEVRSGGQGCLVGGGSTICSGGRHDLSNFTLNGIRITLVAARNSDDSWTIEEVAPQPGPAAQGPDLVVESPSVDDEGPDPGAVFDFFAAVRTRGDAAASATTVRYYRGTDGGVSSSDTEVGNTSLAGLSAGAERTVSLALTAPSTAGTYYYAACADAVADESDTDNNCSASVRLAVSDEEDGDSGPAGFDLKDDNRWPEGIAHANGRLYVGDLPRDKAFAYDASGRRQPEYDFDFDRMARRRSGLTFGNGRFYVLDDADDRVFVHRANGEREPDADFDLDASNHWPEGIAYANGRLYVVHSFIDEKVFVYDTSGERIADADFDLDAENGNPQRIAHGSGRLYVVDGSDGRVYAYETSGTRDPAWDIQLLAENRRPAGITYANGEILVVDDREDRVFRYPEEWTDLVVTAPEPSASNPDADTSFTLSSVVHNVGNKRSVRTRLRFYRSADDTITAADTQIGTRSVAALAGGATTEVSLSLSLAQGCYWCGVCVDAVEDEFVATNNCSASKRFFVGERVAAANLHISEIDLHSDEPQSTGDPIRMTVEVTNRGDADSAPATLAFSGGRTFSLTIPALGPGETHTFARERVGSAQLGTTRYTACIIDVPCEDDPSGNCRSRSVTYVIGDDGRRLMSGEAGT
ncbi:MAG: hypothetical protein F4X99_15190 [Gammaproteobacteria bacterium]|nr:hypothetical protein [Gammaproteobacteria bacterium]